MVMEISKALWWMPLPRIEFQRSESSPGEFPGGRDMQAVTEKWHLTLVPGKDGRRIRNEAKTTGRPNPADYVIACRLPG